METMEEVFEEVVLEYLPFQDALEVYSITVLGIPLFVTALCFFLARCFTVWRD